MTDPTLPPGLVADGPATARRAFVTLVSNAAYLPGAEALLRSLRLTGTSADLAVMHRGLDADALARLSALGARLIRADLLPTSDAFDQAHARDALHARAAFLKGGKPDFHTPLDNFIKLRLWQLTEYFERLHRDHFYGHPFVFQAEPNLWNE